MPSQVSRRTFLRAASASAVLAVTGALPPDALAGGDGAAPVPMPMTPLGRSRVPVSRIAVGGWHYGVEMPEADALSMLARAFDLGMNFYDTAFSYGRNGESEIRLGKAFKGRRDKVVLMTKSYQRDAEGADYELDLSLRRMRTDYVDLWQFHSVGTAAQAEQICRKGGALETARKALKDGRVRMLGATGHTTPEGLNRILELVPEIEALQFPVNCVDLHWQSFMASTLGRARDAKVSVLAMKTLAMGSLARAREIVTVEEAHRYALSQPIDVWISGVTSAAQLEENIKLLKSFKPMTAEEQAALLARTKPIAGPKTETYKAW